MLRHNLLLIFRSFKRFKNIFFINLIGLSSGLACALFIYLWVSDELNVDKFHTKKDRLYYAWEHRIKADGIWTSPTTSGPFSEALKADMPEVELACPATRPQPFTVSIGEKVLKARGRYTGKDFFNLFTYPLLAGQEAQVLLDKKAIVISRSLSMSLFNRTDNVLGEMIELDHNDQYMVTGVFEDVPPASSEQFDFVMSFEKFREENNFVDSWGNTGAASYVLLKEGTDANAFNKKIANFVTLKTNGETTHRTPFLKKYSEIYLYGKYENGKLTGGRITYVKLFSMIAVFILIIACINFMNLSTAKASRRIKDVGIKKAIGAARISLINQYLGESLLISSLAMMVAILIVDVLMSPFNAVTGKTLSLILNLDMILMLSLIVLIAGILAGSYPALYLSGFRTAAVLKGKLSTSLGEVWARKGLVVFQFALSVILIVAVFVVYKQLEFIQTKDLGYQRDNVLYFRCEGITNDFAGQETMLSEIKNIPGVVNASSIGHDLSGHNSGTYGIVWDGKDPEDHTEFENVTVNYDMMETLGIHMTAGRMFSRSSPGDTAKIIINESGIKFMGLKEPIGATIKLWGDDRQIIGIAKDFHYESLHENFKPAFFRLAPDDTYMIMVKIEGKDQDDTIAKLQSLYQRLNPGFTFDYKFLDERHRSLYIAERRVSILSRYFAGLAILISCLGLFGLASFTAERRLKEIGIRKVLGSSELGIIYLLSSDFTKTVFIAIMISLPFSYWLTSFWLQGFAFRISLTAWYFISSGLVALLIAWITVGIQAMRAARVNPTRCLKEE